MNLSSNSKLSHSLLHSLKQLLPDNQIIIFSPMDKRAPVDSSMIICGSCQKNKPSAEDSQSFAEPRYQGPLTVTLLLVTLRGTFWWGSFQRLKALHVQLPSEGSMSGPDISRHAAASHSGHLSSCSAPTYSAVRPFSHCLTLLDPYLQCGACMSRVLSAFPKALSLALRM